MHRLLTASGYSCTGSGNVVRWAYLRPDSSYEPQAGHDQHTVAGHDQHTVAGHDQHNNDLSQPS